MGHDHSDHDHEHEHDHAHPHTHEHREVDPNHVEFIGQRPVLNVANVAASLAYYVGKLGFELGFAWSDSNQFGGGAAPEGQRERNKREKRERLLRAAAELFEKKGFAGATAREICGRAQIGTGTLFLYARDKRDLLFRVFDGEARRLFAEAAAGARGDEPLVDALVRLFGGFIAFYAAHPVLARDLAEQFFLRRSEQPITHIAAHDKSGHAHFARCLADQFEKPAFFRKNIENHGCKSFGARLADRLE